MRYLDRAASALLFLLGLLLIAMVLLSVCNVVSRYVFNRALLWADEITVFAMIVLAWLGALACGWRNADIRMDILTDLLPAQVRRGLHVVQQAAISGLCLWVSLQAWPYVTRAYGIGMRSDAAGFPLWLVHAVIPVSLVLIALIAALRCLRLIAGYGPVFFQPRSVREPAE